MKSLKALFVLALVAAFVAPAYAETQNVKVSGSLDAYWFYRSNFDLRDNNDIGVVPAGTAAGLYDHHPGSGSCGPDGQRLDRD